MRKFISTGVMVGSIMLLSVTRIAFGATGQGGSGAIGAGGGSPSVTLGNPLGEKKLIDLFNDLIDVVLIFALPLIVFFIIFSGFQYVMASGNPEKITSASRSLLYAIVGGVLILGAKVLIVVISGTIDAIAAP